jgi:hypothetical protein
MNWSAYFRAAEEEMSSFLVNPANSEWRDTMYARVAEEIISTIAMCSGENQAVDIKLSLIRKCKAKADHQT